MYTPVGFPKENFVFGARGGWLVGWMAWHRNSNGDEDGVDSPASDPVLVWRPTLWSVEYLTPVLARASPCRPFSAAHWQWPGLG